MSEGSAADILQFILEQKLALKLGEKDMVVMLHEIAYLIDDTLHCIESSLVTIGTDEQRTAMAKTVGLPLGIAAVLILEGKIQEKGLHIPINAGIYEPVLAELANESIRFIEKHSSN
jgi:saccharopine dehydrogenase (NADP+, L-glutamate forming)